VNCHRVVEFESPETIRIQETMAREHGFLPVRHRLEIYGLCGTCQAGGVQLPDEGLTCPVELLA
jgi:Fur family ferric uptake transcriptional regulator